MHYTGNGLYLVLKSNEKIMKKMPLAFLLYCTVTLLSFTACSPGYGCAYAAAETMREQSESSAVNAAVDCANAPFRELISLP